MEFKDVEEFRGLITELALPRHADVLFGIRCAVCGKSDRISLLESPEELDGKLAKYDRYKELWSMCKIQNDELAVCKFCGYVLSIDWSEKSASVVTG